MGGTICVCDRKPDQVAKAVLWLPWFITSRFIHSIQLAEERLGTPPTTVEVLTQMNKTYPLVPIHNITIATAVVMSIIREDMVFMDDISYRMSLKRHEGFTNFSEKFRKHFGTQYMIDKQGAIMAAQQCKTVNLASLLDMLKSKDERLLAENQWIFEGQSRFLDLEPVSSKIAFLSFPRSGNSLMRKVLE